MDTAALPYLQPVPISSAPVWLQAARVSVAAGFPSPAEDHQVERIELVSQKRETYVDGRIEPVFVFNLGLRKR